MKDLLVFIPGIMGSCLRVPPRNGQAGKRLWFENTSRSLSELVQNPALYKWNPGLTLDSYDILSEVRVLFFKKQIYGPLRQTFQSFSEYEYLEFPYDWRQDIRMIARVFGEWLNANISRKKENPGNQCQISIVAHSMGGLISALALIEGYVDPKQVIRFISIATPFYGAPIGFKALSEIGYLPGATWLDRAVNWRRDRRKCKQILLEALASFTSVYQLLPHHDEIYVELSDGRSMNPLSEGIFDPATCAAANEAHTTLSQFDQFIRSYPAMQTLFIYGDYPNNTDKLYTADVGPTAKTYTNLNCYKRTNGDGTVPVTSSSVGNNVISKLPVVGGSHAYMCSDPRVLDLLTAYLTSSEKSSAAGGRSE